MLDVLGLILVIPYVAQATDSDCIVYRKGNSPLHARECKKVGSVYNVRSCDTNWPCKANEKSVKIDSTACKDSISAPKFTDTYQAADAQHLFNILREQPEVLKMRTNTRSSSSITSQIAKAGANQKIALVEFDNETTTGSVFLERDPDIARAFSRSDIEFVYTATVRQPKTLRAFAVEKNKLIPVATKEAIASCGDK